LVGLPGRTGHLGAGPSAGLPPRPWGARHSTLCCAGESINAEVGTDRGRRAPRRTLRSALLRAKTSRATPTPFREPNPPRPPMAARISARLAPWPDVDWRTCCVSGVLRQSPADPQDTWSLEGEGRASGRDRAEQLSGRGLPGLRGWFEAPVRGRGGDSLRSGWSRFHRCDSIRDGDEGRGISSQGGGIGQWLAGAPPKRLRRFSTERPQAPRAGRQTQGRQAVRSRRPASGRGSTQTSAGDYDRAVVEFLAFAIRPTPPTRNAHIPPRRRRPTALPPGATRGRAAAADYTNALGWTPRTPVATETGARSSGSRGVRPRGRSRNIARGHPPRARHQRPLAHSSRGLAYSQIGEVARAVFSRTYSEALAARPGPRLGVPGPGASLRRQGRIRTGPWPDLRRGDAPQNPGTFDGIRSKPAADRLPPRERASYDRAGRDYTGPRLDRSPRIYTSPRRRPTARKRLHTEKDLADLGEGGFRLDPDHPGRLT